MLSVMHHSFTIDVLIKGLVTLLTDASLVANQTSATYIFLVRYVTLLLRDTRRNLILEGDKVYLSDMIRIVHLI